ncbi:Rrf2 family transcriptional regulator [Sinobaca sp. H24]|uniref:Rrf2 family transcriptional regulator n=1 Tax=Sinobaca sp. H24 TaxID=2923376 RepID=UPI00207AB5E9|nr:Rrf2 family transcriptional regulator [Sinobaca sp. H24]
MINTRFSVAVHILALSASVPREQLTSEYIAGSVNTNPVVIRRIGSMLKKAGLLDSQAGIRGFALTRQPEAITLLDIYQAVQKEEEALFAVHPSPNPDCPVGKNIQGALDTAFTNAQEAMERELADLSLKNIMNDLFS